MSEVTTVAAKATTEATAAVTAVKADVAAAKADVAKVESTVEADETKAVAFWNQYRVFAIVAAVLIVGVLAFVAKHVL